MHKADGSMVRALAPAGPEVQDEQATMVREVPNARQTTSQETSVTVNGPAAGAHIDSQAEKKCTSHADPDDGLEAAGCTVIKSPVASDAAAAAPVASAHGAIKPAAKAEAVTKWVPSPHVSWLEWPEDANERRLSSGATAVVFR